MEEGIGEGLEAILGSEEFLSFYFLFIIQQEEANDTIVNLVLILSGNPCD